jgi:hypothetical protein
LTRLRLGVLLVLAVAFGTFSHSPKAMAAAEVHHLNLVISVMPSQIDGGGLNDMLDRYNQYPLGSRGLEGLNRITMGWFFDAEMRYFVRPNFALAAGAGQLKVETKREYLPNIGASINVRGEVLTVPVHVGAQYYLAPYTQGDFQARAFVGGGLLSLTSTRALFTTEESGLPLRGDTLSVSSLGGDSRLVGTGDGAGYYAEVGAHLFFAARYSVILGAVYRSMRVRDMAYHGVVMVPLPNKPPAEAPRKTELTDPDGQPYYRIPKLDLSGVGVRMAVAIGF